METCPSARLPLRLDTGVLSNHVSTEDLTGRRYSRQNSSVSSITVQAASLAEKVLMCIVPSCSPAVLERMRREGIMSQADLAGLDKDDLRELGLTMVERSRVMRWARERCYGPSRAEEPQSQAEPAEPLSVSAEAQKDQTDADTPGTPMDAIHRMLNAQKCSPSRTGEPSGFHAYDLSRAFAFERSVSLESLAEIEEGLEQHLDEVEQQADFWYKVVDDDGALQLRAQVEKVSQRLQTDGDKADLTDLRETMLEKLFDLSPERLKEVYESIDRDSDGRIIKEDVREGLLRCELHGLDRSLEMVLTKLSTDKDGSLQLSQFESMLTRLKLAQLLTGKGNSPNKEVASGLLTVLDYNRLTVDLKAAQRPEALRNFFFGHRVGDFPLRWVHMSGFNLTLLLALTVKYQLHPLGVEDVIDQSPTRLDRYGVHWFAAIEHLCLADNARGANGYNADRPVMVRARHVTLFCAGPPKTDTLITIAQADRSFARDWPGGNASPDSAYEGSSDLWVELLQKRLKAVRSRVRERRADFLMYEVIDLCADDIVRLTGAYAARVGWLERLLNRWLNGQDDQRMEWFRRGGPTWFQEVDIIRLQLAVLTRRLRGLNRILRRLADDRDIFPDARGYLEDVADHINEAHDDAGHLSEKCISLFSAYEHAEDRQQERTRQRQEAERALRDERMNRSIAVLTILTSIFTPVTFLVGVYGMNFQRSDGRPAIPELLNPNGYFIFWIFTSTYLLVSSIGGIWLWRRLTNSIQSSTRSSGAASTGTVASLDKLGQSQAHYLPLPGSESSDAAAASRYYQVLEP